MGREYSRFQIIDWMISLGMQMVYRQSLLFSFSISKIKEWKLDESSPYNVTKCKGGRIFSHSKISHTKTNKHQHQIHTEFMKCTKLYQILDRFRKKKKRRMKCVKHWFNHRQASANSHNGLLWCSNARPNVLYLQMFPKKLFVAVYWAES